MSKNRIHPANKPALKSQRDKILAWLEKGKTITQLQAYNLFRCTRLGARLFELKHMGHVIQYKWIKTRTGQVIKQYSLIQYQAGI
jgi:hypothetical protein